MIDGHWPGLRARVVLRVPNQCRQTGVRFEDFEQRLAPGATAANRSGPLVFGVEAWVARTLASETDGTEFQHKSFKLDGMNTIIVAGHAICKRPEAAELEESWILLEFQKGEVACYIEHIRTGVERAAADEASLLVFAGGYSRADAGPRSEGAGYYWIADHYGWWGHPEVAQRAVTEEFSRDSYENLLFSICRTREFTGHWPEHVSLVSWAFKQDRFDLHREAIRWPAARYEFVGPNNPSEIGQALTAEARTADGYRVDPYSAGPEYRAKRDSRNPFRRHHGYSATCPEVAGLFDWAERHQHAGDLPWASILGQS